MVNSAGAGYRRGVVEVGRAVTDLVLDDDQDVTAARRSAPTIPVPASDQLSEIIAVCAAFACRYMPTCRGCGVCGNRAA